MTRLIPFLNLLCLISVVWGLLLPRPYAWALSFLLILPWLAVCMLPRCRAAVGLHSRKIAQPDVTLLLASFLLTIHALPFQPLDELRTAKLLVSLATLLFTAILIADRTARADLVRAAFLLCPALLYGYSAVRILNGVLDRSSPKTHLARVVEKTVAKGKYGKGPCLKLDTLGPYDCIGVPLAIYNSVQVKEEVCVHLRQGALGIKWYRNHECIERCP